MTTARIRIERGRSLRSDIFRAYKVVIDGQEVGAVKRGASLTHEVPAGRHELHLRIDWARSRSLELDLTPAEEVLVRCAPQVNPLRALYWMTIGRRRWIGIELVDPAVLAAR